MPTRTASRKKSSSRAKTGSMRSRGRSGHSAASKRTVPRSKAAAMGSRKSASRSRKSAHASGRSGRSANRSPARSQSASRTRSRSSTANRSRRSAHSGKITTDHEEIREWVESRGGHPSSVAGTERGSETAGLLRIDFPDFSGERSLEPIDWDDFFEKFEESKLAFLYDPDKGSKFNKFIARGKRRF